MPDKITIFGIILLSGAIAAVTAGAVRTPSSLSNSSAATPVPVPVSQIINHWYTMSPEVWMEYLQDTNDTNAIKCHISDISPKEAYDTDEALQLNPTISKTYNSDGTLNSATVIAIDDTNSSQQIAYTYFTSEENCETYYLNKAQQQANQTNGLQ